MVAGLCLDHWAGAQGYKVFFGILLAVSVVGLIATFAWMKLTKVKRMEILASKKAA